jgi:hypothetical protein
VSEQAPESNEENVDVSRERFLADFPATGEFLYEELETDDKRKVFLRVELARKGLKSPMPEESSEV